MQRVVGASAGETLDVTVDRDGARLVLKATPTLKEVKDNFGNVQRIGILGISRSMAPEDLKLHPVAPPQAVWLAVQETWSVIDRTLSYIGGVITGREAANQLGRTDPHRADVGAGGEFRLCSADPARCRRCRYRSGCSTCFQSRCSMAVTFCSTSSKVFAGVRCRKGPRKWVFASASRSS